jgi:hypothetical protein
VVNHPDLHQVVGQKTRFILGKRDWILTIAS